MKGKMKLISLCFLCFLCFGCTVQYDLNIDGDTFKENIQMKVRESDIADPEVLEAYNGFKQAPSPALTSKDIPYKKTIKQNAGITTIDLNYAHNIDTYEDTYYVNTCFEFHKFSNENTYYYVQLGGNFLCNYGEGDLKFRLTTNQKMIQNNADAVEGNTYIWNLDPNNMDDRKIIFQVSKVKKVDGKSGSFVVPLLILLFLIGILSFVFWTIGQKLFDKIGNKSDF